MNERIFEAPGPGCWVLDSTHLSKPVSAYTTSACSGGITRGFKEGTERYGLFLSHLDPVHVHGFSYIKLQFAFVPEDAPPGPPPEGFFDNPDLIARLDKGPAAFEKKLWRQDLKRWDEEIKPDSIRRYQSLKSVSPDSLDNEALVKHLHDCYENVGLMWFRHHLFSVPALLPTGLYISRVCPWAGISTSEALTLLKGSSPVSKGLAIDELKRIAKILRAQNVNPSDFAGVSAADVLQQLRTMPGELGKAVEDYLDIVGYQLVSGYDITEQYALETPEVLIGSIWSVMSDNAKNDGDITQEEINKVRNKVPDEHRKEFDDLLYEARLINRLRDERGVYNEARAFGLARRAILEAGKRLVAEGKLHDAELILQASHEEMLALIDGKNGPAESDLRDRQDWYLNQTTEDVPPFLGDAPSPPPPLEALPPNARLAMGAFLAAIGNLFDEPIAAESLGEIITGAPVSSGIYEGTARVINGPSDFHRLQQGDVLVTKNTAATFNVVLPMLGAIVTDRGGLLSHAAIVSREYGIPCIVGTRTGTQSIRDGARVRVNGAAGIVELL